MECQHPELKFIEYLNEDELIMRVRDSCGNELVNS